MNRDPDLLLAYNSAGFDEAAALFEFEYKFNLLFKWKRGQGAAGDFLGSDEFGDVGIFLHGLNRYSFSFHFSAKP